MQENVHVNIQNCVVLKICKDSVFGSITSLISLVNAAKLMRG